MSEETTEETSQVQLQLGDLVSVLEVLQLA